MSDHNYWIIDADTHVTEPPDLWTSRLPAKWKERAPHIEWDDENEQEVWVIDGERATVIGVTATAGWRDPFPANPPTFADCHRGSHDLKERMKYMDSLGIWAQVLYPNVGGFGTQAFQKIDDANLKLACVQAYNDYLIDWIAPEPRRFAPIMATPFWDVDATVAEIEQQMMSNVPLARFARPQEIADVAAFLASPASSYLNGVNLPVDGGRLAVQ